MKSTKELARELGFLRKRVPAAGKHKSLKKTSNCADQTFSYVIVIDFESTCWKDQKNTSQEIIEFPAVLLNTATGQLEAEFHHYVMPDENPRLSTFCQEFTGISQDQVENGVPLFICLNQFANWLKSLESKKGIAYNRSTDTTKKLCTFLTWSDWDLGVCLHYECQRKQLYKPSALNQWIDARAVYRNFYQRKPKGLNGALQEVGIEFSGRQHSGLDDAKNTARLVWRMIQDGCQLQITKSIQSGKPVAVPRVLNQLGSHQQQTSRGLSATATVLSTSSTSSTSSSHAKRPCTTGRNDLQSHKRTVPTASSTSSRSSMTGTHTTSSVHGKQSGSTGRDEIKSQKRKGSPDRCLIGKPHSAVDQTKRPKNSQGLFSIYKDGSDRESLDVASAVTNTCIARTGQKSCEVGQRSGMSSCENRVNKNDLAVGEGRVKVTRDHSEEIPSNKNLQGVIPLPCGLPGGNKSCKFAMGNIPSPTLGPKQAVEFKTPPACPLPFFNQNSIRKYGKSGAKTTVEVACRTSGSDGSGCGGSSDGFKTPSNCSKPGAGTCSSGVKITPPMCKCGRRSKRRVAARPGPNQGRAFYSCPAPGTRHGSSTALKDSTNTNTSRNGCGFFSWESSVLEGFLPPAGVASPAGTGFVTPGFQGKHIRTPSPLAMGSIQKAIQMRTGQNTARCSMRGGVTPIGTVHLH